MAVSCIAAFSSGAAGGAGGVGAAGGVGGAGGYFTSAANYSSVQAVGSVSMMVSAISSWEPKRKTLRDHAREGRAQAVQDKKLLNTSVRVIKEMMTKLTHRREYVEPE
jgi:hypothetical protein